MRPAAAFGRLGRAALPIRAPVVTVMSVYSMVISGKGMPCFAARLQAQATRALAIAMQNTGTEASGSNKPVLTCRHKLPTQAHLGQQCPCRGGIFGNETRWHELRGAA